MLDFREITIGHKYNRQWLAKHWRFKSYQAIGRGVFCPRGGGQIILFATREKRPGEEQYKNHIANGKFYWDGEKGHGSDERIQHVRENREDIHLFFREMHRDDFEYFGLLELLNANRFTDRPSEFIFRIAG